MKKINVNSEEGRAVISSEVRTALYSYLNKNTSTDKCAVQKYAPSAFNGLQHGRPPGSVGK